MENYIDQYLEYITYVNKTSSNTAVAYKHDLLKMILFLENQGVDEYNKVTLTHLNSFILSLEKDKCATATISRMISAIRSFYTYLFREGVIKSEPSLKLKAPKIEKKIPQVLTQDEIESLMLIPDTNTIKGSRDRAILEIMYATGIRVTELVNIKVQDINLEMKYIMFDNNNSRFIPFGISAHNALDNYLVTTRKRFLKKNTDLLFLNYAGTQMSRQGIWKIIKHYGELAGYGTKITPHTIRHSFAAHMVSNGADLKTIQNILGHVDMSTTEIYSNFKNDKMRDVYYQAHPRK